MSVCLYVRVCVAFTSPCSTESVKRTISQTMSNGFSGTIVLCRKISGRISNGVTPNGVPNTGGVGIVGEFRQITRYNLKKALQKFTLTSLTISSMIRICMKLPRLYIRRIAAQLN